MGLVFQMADITPDFVRLVLDKERRIKLRFRHKEIRNAVKNSGQSIGDLVNDPFGGWPHLLVEGHRPYKPTVTLDEASGWMDDFVSLPDANGEERTLAQMGKLLIDALVASKFLVVKAELKDEPEPADGAEGNGQPEA